MNDESDDLAGPLRELAGEARRRQGFHPSLEDLTSYHAGELTPGAEEEIQEHLAVCRHCNGLLLDLPAFLEAPAGALDSGDAEPDDSWQEIRKHLPGPSGPPGKVERWQESQPERAPSGQPSRRRGLLSLAAAALIVLAAAPLGVVAWRAAVPRFPPATLDLSSIEAQRGTAERLPPPPATVHAAAASTIFILRLARDQPNLRFLLELRGSGPGNSGTSVVLPVTSVIDAHTLLLVLDRHQLAPGRYRLRVLDAERRADEPLGEYALKVVEP